MSFLGGLLGAVGGLLGFAGQQSANDSQMSMLDKQIEWQREVLQHKVQWNVQDLRDAGLNPVLAATGGSSGSAPSVTAPQVGNVGQAAVSSASAIADIVNQFRNTDNNTRKVDSEIAVNSARAQEAEENANFRRALIFSGFPEAQTAREVASAKESFGRIQLMFDQQSQIKSAIRETDQRIKNLEDQRAAIKAQTLAYRAQAKDSDSRAAYNAAMTQLSKVDAELRKEQKSNEMLKGEGLEIENTIKRLGVPAATAENRFFTDPRVRQKYSLDPWSYRRDKGYGVRGYLGPGGIGFEYGLR